MLCTEEAIVIGPDEFLLIVKVTQGVIATCTLAALVGLYLLWRDHRED